MSEVHYTGEEFHFTSSFGTDVSADSSKESSSQDGKISKGNTNTRNKQRKIQHVSSRYLQSAKTYRSSSESSGVTLGNKTVLNSTNLRKTSSTMHLRAVGTRMPSTRSQDSTRSLYSGSIVNLATDPGFHLQAQAKPISSILRLSETPLKRADGGLGALSSTIKDDGILGTHIPFTPLHNISEIGPDLLTPAVVPRCNPAQGKTVKNLENEYLQYLMWAHLDASSSSTFAKQQEEGKRQLAFLTQKLQAKKDEVKELSAKLFLAKTYAEVHKRYQEFRGRLECLYGSAEPCIEAFAAIRDQLGMALHQVKVTNIYIPKDQNSYQEKLVKELEEMANILSSLITQLEPHRRVISEAKSVAEELLQLVKAVDLLKPDLLQAIERTVTEGSLKITQKQMQ